MADFAYPLFPVFAFLGFVLCLIPLPWHLEAWNSGTCYFMIWTSLSCLNQFINSIIWHNNAINWAPVWCDISSRIMLGVSVGIPAASLCINRRLYRIASVHSVAITPAEKRRAVIIDSLICVLFPVVFIAVQYVVQGHRFNIYEDIGCYPDIYNTLLAYFLNSMWPVVIGVTSAVYCSLSIHSFIRRRAQFTQFMSSNKTLTTSRYFRLMALAMTDILCTTPLSVTFIVLNLREAPLDPWVSWSWVHQDWSRVEQIPSFIWQSDKLLVILIELMRWLSPFCAILFFAFFGFAGEAIKHYRMMLTFMLNHTNHLFRLTRLRSRSTASDPSDSKSPIPVGELPLHMSTSTIFIKAGHESSSLGDDRFSEFGYRESTYSLPQTPSTLWRSCQSSVISPKSLTGIQSFSP